MGDSPLGNVVLGGGLGLRGKPGPQVFGKVHSGKITIRTYPRQGEYYVVSVPRKCANYYTPGMPWQGWGKRLKVHMKASGITQEAVAEKLEVTQGAIAHWLGGRREINLEDYFKLCIAAKADPRLILFGDEGDVRLAEVLREALAQNPDLVPHIARQPATDSRVSAFLPPAPKRAAHKKVRKR